MDPAHRLQVFDQLLLGFDSTDPTQGQRVWRGENPESGTPIWYRLRDAQEKDAVKLTLLDAAGEEVAKLDVEPFEQTFELLADPRASDEP